MNSAASQKMGEHGFYLIISMMGGQDCVDSISLTPQTILLKPYFTTGGLEGNASLFRSK